MNGALEFINDSIDEIYDDPVQKSKTEKIVEFYDQASADYEHWSTAFNMHLGFYRLGLNPFDREKMLEQSNLEIGRRLQIDSKSSPVLVDFGCGAGAGARSIAKKYPNSIVKGVTISPLQVRLAAKINAEENLHDQIEIFEADYTALPIEDNSADGVWAVESACYAEGSDKDSLICEMARVLKPGGHFAIADCFIKAPEKNINWLTEKCYLSVCENWALPEMPVLNKFAAALDRRGFQDIVIEDVSWRVAPSLAHAPFAVIGFIIKKLLRGERLGEQSINNLKASLLAIALGLNRSKFSYYFISGRLGNADLTTRI